MNREKSLRIPKGELLETLPSTEARPAQQDLPPWAGIKTFVNKIIAKVLRNKKKTIVSLF